MFRFQIERYSTCEIKSSIRFLRASDNVDVFEKEKSVTDEFEIDFFLGLKLSYWLNVRYSSVLTQNSLIASRKAVLSIAQFEEYPEFFEEEAFVVLVLMDRTTGLRLTVIMIWTVCNISPVINFLANWWSVWRNSWSSKVVLTERIFNFSLQVLDDLEDFQRAQKIWWSVWSGLKENDESMNQSLAVYDA